MRNIGYIFFLFVLITSCNNQKERDLSITLSEQTMADIIKDMSKADYMVAISGKDSVEMKKMRNDYAQTICRHYNTTVEVYNHNLKIYLQNDEVMKRILEKAKQ